MRPLRSLLPLLACLATHASAQVSAHGDRALVLVDPSDAESMYVANEYIAARGIPTSQVLYMRPGATNFQEFADVNAVGFQGLLENRGLRDRIDFVVVAPTADWFVSAPGLISDACVAVNRISIGGAYGLSFITSKILSGTSSQSRNQYNRSIDNATAFDSLVDWSFGSPSNSAGAEKYFMGGLLGYTGPEGNTLQEILDLIQRSAAADGTQPAGTVYFMETTDVNRSGPRDAAFPKEVTDIIADGGQAQHLFADLPLGNHDCIGIMTGRATLPIDTADFTLLPGSFADHLTSFAGRFDTTSQTRMSRWIAKGASGTAGTIEEPCNYDGKFPHAGTHQLIKRGLTLGEAWLRRIKFRPFQNQFYGDPLTAPYGFFPMVDVPSFPSTAVSGTLIITPVASATQPGAALETLELTVDGVFRNTAPAGGSLTLDTTRLADGWHEVRVLAFDKTNERDPGRWVGMLEVDNAGHSVSLSSSANSGDLSQAYLLSALALGGAVDEVQVLHNGRVVGSVAGASGSVTLYGQNLGAGPAQLVARAVFSDGSFARSAPLSVTTDYLPGSPSSIAPVAHSYSRIIYDDVATVLELPASFQEDPSMASYSITSAALQATQLNGGSGAFIVLSPNPGANGSDSLSFEVTTPGGTSSSALISLTYAKRPSNLRYGSGVNPLGSIAFLGGKSAPGEHFQVGIDNPLGTQAAGAMSILYFSQAPDPNFPAGSLLKGFGMSGAGTNGELLMALGANLVHKIFGPAWLGSGQPSIIDVDVPADPMLVGLTIYLQGLLLDPTSSGGTGTMFGLTEGIELTIGDY